MYRNKLTKWLVAIVIFACLVTGAKAVQFSSQSTIKDPQIKAWVEISKNYWKADLQNCSDGLVLKTGATSGSETDAIANAVINGCSISISPKWFPKPSSEDTNKWETAVCNAMVHEYGHLLGKTHSSDPNNVMYYKQTASNGIPACVSKAVGTGADDFTTNIGVGIPTIKNPTVTTPVVTPTQPVVTKPVPAKIQKKVTLKQKGKKVSVKVKISNTGEASSKALKVCVGVKGAKVIKKKNFQKIGKRLCTNTKALTPESEKTLSFGFKGKGKKAVVSIKNI